MDEPVFSTDELRVMREAFDAVAEQRATSRDHLARLVIRAAREQGAGCASDVIERVEFMLRAAEQREM